MKVAGRVVSRHRRMLPTSLETILGPQSLSMKTFFICSIHLHIVIV